jgi:hypothetical protein
LRIIIKVQHDLWIDGVRAGAILGEAEVAADESEDSESEDDEAETPDVAVMNKIRGRGPDAYCAGKWGRYVRAPDVYFDIMRRFGKRFVALGEVAAIRRGITSGCDDFFMPKDITADMLSKHKGDRVFREHTGGATRKDVESDKLRIIEAGDESIHPIESEYLAPEVHSLMNLDRPIVHADDLDRVVLLVGESMDQLKTKSPWVWRYLRYGMSAPFPSKKAKPGPVNTRSTCVPRDPWYDLTGLSQPAFAFWPKGQQYRHMLIANPDGFPCNCRLYELTALGEYDTLAFTAVLNSTIVALWRNFYGRYTGTEGALETMVLDTRLIDVPSPVGASVAVCSRLKDAFVRLGARATGDLVEEQLMDCHTPDRARKLAAGPLVLSKELQQSDRRYLDDAVLELLGVSAPRERNELIGRLYEATARHFRDIRVVEIEKMEQRAKADNRRFSVHDLAADVWDAAELEDDIRLAEWIAAQMESNTTVTIPEDRPARLSDNPMFAPSSVYFGKKNQSHTEFASLGQAELVVRLANLGLSGSVKMPEEARPCLTLLARIEERLDNARVRFKELAESRAGGDERVEEQLVEVLERWFVLGREPAKADMLPDAETDP